MTYTEIFKKSFNTWWNNKKYWLFAGIALIGSFASSSNNYYNSDTLSESDYGYIFGIILLFGLLAVTFQFAYTLLVGLPLNIGLTMSYKDIENGESQLGFFALLKLGYKNWARVALQKLAILVPLILLGVIVFVIIFVVSAIFLGLAFSTSGASNESDLIASGGILFTLLMCCLFPVFLLATIAFSILFNVGNEFATRHLLFENMDVIESIKKGFGFTIHNFKSTLAVGFLSYLTSIIASIPAFIVIFIVSFFSTLLLLATTSIFSNAPFLMILIGFFFSIVTAIIYGMLMGVTNSYLICFYNTAFSKFYPAMIHPVNGELGAESTSPLIAESASRSPESK